MYIECNNFWNKFISYKIVRGIVMNLKKQNGYVGVDIAVSLMILMILLPTITGMMYNISKTNSETAREAKAINLTTNALEIAKSIGVGTLSVANWQSGIKNEFTEVKNEGSSMVLEEDTGAYKINLSIVDYASSHGGVTANKVKTVTAEVQYFVSGETKSIKISTVIT